MKLVENQLEALKDKRDKLMTVFGVNDVEIGENIMVQESLAKEGDLPKIDEERTPSEDSH